MKVRELIQKLSALNQDADVVVYKGDYGIGDVDDAEEIQYKREIHPENLNMTDGLHETLRNCEYRRIGEDKIALAGVLVS